MTNTELLRFIESRPDNFSIQLKRHHREFFDEIDRLYSYPTFGEKLYRHIHGEDVGKCEVCGQRCRFDGFHRGYRKRCSYKCMNGLKKVPAIEKTCPICGKMFKTDKRHNRVTCSTKCQSVYVASPTLKRKTYNATKNALIKKYGVDHPSKMSNHVQMVKLAKLKKYGNPNYVNPEKAKRTKQQRYGSSLYNNTEKTKETCLKKYGATCVFHSDHCPKAVGIRISKFQRSVYEQTLVKCPDALIEHYLTDANHSVDIYVPSERKIVECYGDYWHCNPKKYNADYYNKMVKKTAQEIWDRDEMRLNQLHSFGYIVEVVWESDWKQPII